MSLHAIQRPDGRLCEIRDWSDAEREGRFDLVPLARMPDGLGPLVYDAERRLAVPAPLTLDERADQVSLPARVFAAMVVEARPLMFTLAERERAKNILDSAAQNVRDRIRSS